jgi:hypothetical protein
MLQMRSTPDPFPDVFIACFPALACSQLAQLHNPLDETRVQEIALCGGSQISPKVSQS